jgi:hypothetical protein
LQIFVVAGTKSAFGEDSDLIGIFILSRFDFLREPKPSFRHREEERLRNGVFDLLGHAQAFGCVAAMILGAGHYAPSLDAQGTNAGRHQRFPGHLADSQG